MNLPVCMDAFHQKLLERRLRSQDTDLQIMMETDGFTAKLEENSAKESSQDDEVNLKSLIIRSSTRFDAFLSDCLLLPLNLYREAKRVKMPKQN